MTLVPQRSDSANQLGPLTTPRDAQSIALAEMGGAVAAPTGFAGFRCGNCGADDIQKLSVVYEAGTSIINARTSGTSTGFGMAGGGGFGLGTAVNSSRTTGTQMSALAKRAAPPKPRAAGAWVAFAIIGGLIGIMIFGFVLTALIVAGCAAMAMKGFRYNNDVYPGLRSAWEQSWLCHRCGTISRIQ